VTDKVQSASENKRTIVVAVDFSSPSEAATLFAADMAAATQCRLLVLHVIHDPGDAPGYYKIDGRDKQLTSMADVGAEMLEDFIARLQQEHPDKDALRTAETMFVAGIPVPRIMEVVERVQPTMLVMGSTGRTRLNRMMLGSKSGQAVHVCPVPITIVPEPNSET
jgi:nucleotide-binding universal stress UspA family protein